MTSITKLIVVLPVVALTLLCNCRGGNATSGNSVKENDKCEIEMQHSRYLRMYRMGEGTLVRIINAWDTTSLMGEYFLVPEGYAGNIPQGAEKIEVPLKRSIVFSAVHVALISELGAGDIITGICDGKYIYDTDILKKIADGKVMDCGAAMQPNIEKMISLKPSGILLSPYENPNGIRNNHGIPMIWAADYLEPGPLGRAEWMRFYGRLFGKGEEADSLFELTAVKYERLKKMAADCLHRPTVLIDKIYGSVWYVPTSTSVTGKLIEDAGGKNPFNHSGNGVTLALSPEKVLMEGSGADFWLIRYNSKSSFTLEDLLKENNIYSGFKAVRENGVWGSNTSTSHIFEDAAFHPQYILEDMISILHPEISVSDTIRYYHPVK